MKRVQHKKVHAGKNSTIKVCNMNKVQHEKFSKKCNMEKVQHKMSATRKKWNMK